MSFGTERSKSIPLWYVVVNSKGCFFYVKQLVMTTTNSFTAVSAQGAAAVHTYQAGAIYSPGLPLSGREFATFFPKKEFFPKFFLSLLRTLHINNLANGLKQKVSLASHGCWCRKGQRHFVSDMWRSTLPDAFLFNNLVK